MIGIGLDILLIALLVGALWFGVKLEKKLRYLRETQAGFAGAAAELNMAIARAEGGLQEMKRTAAEAQLVLGDRLQDARALNARLEQKMTIADKAVAAMDAAVERRAADAERAAAGLEQRTAAAERASVGLDAMIRRAEVKAAEMEAQLSAPARDDARPLAPSGAPRHLPREAGEEKAEQPRINHLAMLRREAAAKREALAAVPAEDEAEELVLDAPLRAEALSRPAPQAFGEPRARARLEDELFEPARAVGARR